MITEGAPNSPEHAAWIVAERAKLRPATHCWGLSEELRALRLYIGLSQREMADRMGKARRDYQRIENGQDKCPPGLLGRIEELADAFSIQVDVVINQAERHVAAHDGAPLPVAIDLSGTPGKEWERLVAGRAYVEAPADAITLTIIGDEEEETA